METKGVILFQIDTVPNIYSPTLEKHRNVRTETSLYEGNKQLAQTIIQVLLTQLSLQSRIRPSTVSIMVGALPVVELEFLEFSIVLLPMLGQN